MPARFVRVAKGIAKRMMGPLIFGRSILIYHRIAKADFDPWNLAVMPDEFERQLAKMRSKTVLPLQEFVRLHVRKRLLRNAVGSPSMTGMCVMLSSRRRFWNPLEVTSLPGGHFTCPSSLSKRCGLLID